MDEDTSQDTSDAAWNDLLIGLAAAWTARDGETPVKDDGERYLAAARIVSRGT